VRERERERERKIVREKEGHKAIEIGRFNIALGAKRTDKSHVVLQGDSLVFDGV
jgi:hypothetical protein